MASMLRSATERDVVVIEFPRPDQFPLGAVREILSLTEAEIVRIAEVGAVTRSSSGMLSLLTEPFGDRSNPLSAFGEHPRLTLRWDEIVELTATLEPGRSAALFVFELEWATDLYEELFTAGCRTTRSPPALGWFVRLSLMSPPEIGLDLALVSPLLALVAFGAAAAPHAADDQDQCGVNLLEPK